MFHIPFFFSLIAAWPQGTTSQIRAPVPWRVWGPLCQWLGIQHTQPTAARGLDEWQVRLSQEGARQEVAPWDCPSEPFSELSGLCSSSSWHRITQDLITTTWWQPGERSPPSLNVMVWMLWPVRETLKWLLLGMMSAYQGKDHSINMLFLTFFLQASVTAFCQRKDIWSLTWLSASNHLVLWLGL